MQNQYQKGLADTRPWGTWEVLDAGKNHCVKHIKVFYSIAINRFTLRALNLSNLTPASCICHIARFLTIHSPTTVQRKYDVRKRLILVLTCINELH